MSLYRAQAVVLRGMRLAEADRIVHLATDKRGKVRAVVKGVRRTQSRWGGRMEPLTHVALQLWEGRELDTVTQAEVLDPFRAVRQDLERLGKAAVMAEVMDQLMMEASPAESLYRMLVGALGVLESGDISMVLAGFLWKVLAAEGVAPDTSSCVHCGGTGELVAFDPGQGGFCCRSCRQGLGVSSEALGLVRLCLTGGLAEALRAPPSPATSEAEHLGLVATERHIERKLRSAVLLKRS